MLFRSKKKHRKMLTNIKKTYLKLTLFIFKYEKKEKEIIVLAD